MEQIQTQWQLADHITSYLISESSSTYLSLVKVSLLMGSDAGAIRVLPTNPLGDGDFELTEGYLHG